MPKHRTPNLECGILVPLSFLGWGQLGWKASGVEVKAMPKHRTPNLECGILMPLSFSVGSVGVEDKRRGSESDAETSHSKFGVRHFGAAFFLGWGQLGWKTSGVEVKAMPKHRTPNLECGILMPLSFSVGSVGVEDKRRGSESDAETSHSKFGVRHFGAAFFFGGVSWGGRQAA